MDLEIDIPHNTIEFWEYYCLDNRRLGRQYMSNKFYSNKVYANEPNKIYNYREIADSEIVLDLDYKAENNETIKEIVEHYSKLLLELGIKHQVWASGGDGYHIHMIFIDLLLYEKDIRQKYREYFLQFFGLGTAVDYHKCYEKTMITMEKTKHKKGGIKTLMIDNGLINTHLPATIKAYYDMVQFQTNFNNKNKYNDYIATDFKNCNGSFNLPCMDYLLANLHSFSNFRERTAFLLVGYLKFTLKYDRDKIINIIETYFTKVDFKNTSAETLYNQVKHHFTCKYLRTALMEMGRYSLCQNCPKNQKYINK